MKPVGGPGRELDALVYSAVFSRNFTYTGDVPPLVPHYSTDIAAAWEVVEKLQNGHLYLSLDGLGFDGEMWRCFFGWHSRESIPNAAVGEAETAPLAICLAALKAVGAGVPE